MRTLADRSDLSATQGRDDFRSGYQDAHQDVGRYEDGRYEHAPQDREQGPNDPRYEAAPQPTSRDLTLGTTALLGIFFAVALVCAVFFGFGYSTGRHLHVSVPSAHATGAPATRATGSNPPAVDQATDQDEDPADAARANPVTSPALTAVTPPARPAMSENQLDPAARMPGRANPKPSPAGAFSGTGASQGTAANHVQTLPAGAALSLRHPAGAPGSRIPTADRAWPPAGSTPVEAVPAGSIMVQIAAVAHQGDADTLARALRKNGFQAVVRSEPQDKFLHVQVGPFATREQARGMRARLQADGYDAFMKP